MRVAAPVEKAVSAIAQTKLSALCSVAVGSFKFIPIIGRSITERSIGVPIGNIA
jgi:hypothetical protein